MNSSISLEYTHEMKCSDGRLRHIFHFCNKPLAAIIESDTDLPLGSGALFLFTNKQRDKIKVLYWDKTGFALWYKRLEKAKYKWPAKEQNEVFTLTQFELDRLLSGFTIIGQKPVQINDFTMT
jgi:transposase